MSKRAHEDSDAERLAGRVDVLVQQLGNFVARHNADDNKVRIVNLASEFGRTLNGRMARVVGNPSREECQDAVLGKSHARVRVKVEGENEPVKMRMCNLLPSDARYEPDGGKVTLTTARARELVAAVVNNQRDDIPNLQERQDVIERIRAADAWLAKTEGVEGAGAPIIPVIKCGALGRPPSGTPRAVENSMNQVCPACSGSGDVTFETYGDGIVGIDCECVVCTEPVAAGGDAMGLPCRHVFHRKCLEQWLATRTETNQTPNCPTCRTELAMSHELYAADYDAEEMLRRRFAEYFTSGFCVCCQAQMIEVDPVVYLDPLNGTAPVVLTRSQLPAQIKYGVRYPGDVIKELPDGFMITRCQGERKAAISINVSPAPIQNDPAKDRSRRA